MVVNGTPGIWGVTSCHYFDAYFYYIVEDNTFEGDLRDLGLVSSCFLKQFFCSKKQEEQGKHGEHI